MYCYFWTGDPTTKREREEGSRGQVTRGWVGGWMGEFGRKCVFAFLIRLQPPSTGEW